MVLIFILNGVTLKTSNSTLKVTKSCCVSKQGNSSVYFNNSSVAVSRTYSEEPFFLFRQKLRDDQNVNVNKYTKTSVNILEKKITDTKLSM